MEKAVILLSGGLDSCVSASIAARKYKSYALAFDYGQAHNEIEAAEKIAQKLNINLKVIKLNFLENFLKQKSERKIPELESSELDNVDVTTETMKRVWVPARNLVFASIAASFAEANDCGKIFAGFNAEEGATFPDNTQEFVDKFNEVLKFGVLKEIEIEAPLILLNKEEIVKLGDKLNAPMELSWSCYKNGEVHCGKCESCQRRKRGFESADVPDLTEYEK